MELLYLNEGHGLSVVGRGQELLGREWRVKGPVTCLKEVRSPLAVAPAATGKEMLRCRHLEGRGSDAVWVH